MRLLKTLIILAISMILCSCEGLAFLQLYPESITRISGPGIDLTEVFGVYEVHSGDSSQINLRVIENLNHRYLIVSYDNAAEGKPKVVVIDSDSMTIKHRMDYSMNIRSIGLGLLDSEDNDYDWWGENQYWNSSFEGEPVQDFYGTNGFHLVDDSGRFSYSFEGGYMSNNDAPPENPDDGGTGTETSQEEYYFSNVRVLEGASETGAMNTMENNATPIEIYISTEAEGFYLSQALTDIIVSETSGERIGGDTIMIGFNDKNEVLVLKKSFSDFTSTSDPHKALNLGESSYTWQGDNYYGFNFYHCETHYTHKGWAKLEETDGYPEYRLYNLETGLALSKSSLTSGNFMSLGFSYDGLYYYYIDKSNLRLYKATTGW